MSGAERPTTIAAAMPTMTIRSHCVRLSET
jgi:hypothetical protein